MSRFSSIAFPALGTGNLGYPKEKVAQLMFETVETFDKENPGSTVTDVRFVVYERDLAALQAFQAYERKIKAASSERGYPSHVSAKNVHFQLGQGRYQSERLKSILKLNPK